MLKICLSEYYETLKRKLNQYSEGSDHSQNKQLQIFFEVNKLLNNSFIDDDEQDALLEIHETYSSIKKGKQASNIIFYTVLDYTAPIAAQTSLLITKKVDGGHLQFAYTGPLELFYLAILPLRQKTVLLLLSKNGSLLGQQYKESFMSLSFESKLNELFYLLLRYKSHDYFFSPKVIRYLDDPAINHIASIEDSYIMGFDIASYEDVSMKQNLPQILSRDYSMQELLNV